MKYYENLDDFDDGSRSPVLDWVEWFVSRVIVIGAVGLVFAFCGALESL
ncbi:MAG: hypothetical protein QM657_18305 [Lacrimispora sp.]